MRKLCDIVSIFIFFIISNLTADFLFCPIKRESYFSVSVMKSKKNLIPRCFLCKFNSRIGSRVFVRRGYKSIVYFLPFTVAVYTVNRHIKLNGGHCSIRIFKMLDILFPSALKLVSITCVTPKRSRVVIGTNSITRYCKNTERKRCCKNSKAH